MKHTHFHFLILLLIAYLLPDGSIAQNDVHDITNYATIFKDPNDSVEDVDIISFSPNGQTLASVNFNAIRLWDVETGKHLKNFQETDLSGKKGRVHSIWFSQDGQTLASGSHNALAGRSDSAIRLWDVETGQLLKKITLQGDAKNVLEASFSPDGRTLAGTSGSGFTTDYDDIYLWNVRTGRHLKTFQQANAVTSVSFSPDGQMLASASGAWENSEYLIYLWDVRTGRHLKTLSGHEERVFSVSFSPDGRILACASYDKNIHLWNVTTGEHLKKLQGHWNMPTSVSFSPDGRTLASADRRGTIYLWNVEKGRRLSRFGRVTNVEHIAFSPDGKTFASVSYGHILLWRIAAHPSSPNAYKVYENAIRGVMWLVNPGVGEGSGVLINKKSRIAVTNAHVTGPKHTIDVFFPVSDEKGELIIDRNFYLTNTDMLKQLGYYTKGHVIGKNEKTDLAIIRLDGLPETAREINWNLNTPTIDAGEMVYILGNPVKQDLWRWTLGEFLKDYGNFLHIQSDVFGGNSGGPVLNKQGILIGIVARSDKLMHAHAIPAIYINRLLSE